MPRHRNMIPFPAAVVSHPYGSDVHADAALHEEVEDEGKKRSNGAWALTTTTADSEQDYDNDEWDLSSRSSNRKSQSREDEANAYQHEYQHVMLEQREIEESAEEHHAGSNAQQVIVMDRGNIKDNSQYDSSNSDNNNCDAHWSCPRCTLHNPAATTACVACNFKHQQTATATVTTTPTTAIRPSDPVRRERLFPQQQQQQQQQRYRSTDDHRSRQSRLLAALVQSDTNTNTRSIASHAAATSTFATSSQPHSQQQSQQHSQQSQALYHSTLAHLIGG
jgi:hypothetical protein